MKTVFFGRDGRQSTRPLESLAKRFEILRVVGPSYEKGGNLENFARHLKVEMRRVSHLDPSLADGADLLVFSNFPKRVPASLLERPKFGCLNLHPSLLPDFRCYSPWLWQFYHAEKEGGWTVHLMDEGLDTGPVLAQSKFTIPFGIDVSDLIDGVLQSGADLLSDTALAWVKGELTAVPQIGSGRPAPKTERGARLVNWKEWPVRRVYHFINGTSPWHEALPSAWGWRWRPLNWEEASHSQRPGSLRWRPGGWRVYCRDGWILLKLCR